MVRVYSRLLGKALKKRCDIRFTILLFKEELQIAIYDYITCSFARCSVQWYSNRVLQ